MIKNAICFTLLLFSGVSLFSQSIGGIDDVDIPENIPNVSITERPLPTFSIDSLSVIPFFDEYCKWSTTKVHPYKVDLSKMTDTIPLVLSHNDCDYAHSVCGKINSEFGYRRSRFHYGIDVDLNTGDAVLASFEGMVRIAKYDPTYGKVVVIRHQNGLETLYAHLSKFEIKVGDYVQAGEPLMEGTRVPNDILRVLGVKELAKFLVKEIQEVYRLQGVKINDKHIEVIVRQMLQKVKIVDSGDSSFLENDKWLYAYKKATIPSASADN